MPREMMFSVSVLDQEVRDYIEKYPGKHMRIVQEELFKIGMDLRNTVIKNMQNTPRDYTKTYAKGHHPSKPGHPPAPNSGNYIKNINVKTIIGGAMVYVENTPYAPILEEGATGPWQIRVRRQKVLSDWERFFGKEVTHPGIAPRPVWGPAIERLNPIDRIKERILSENR